MEEWKHIGADFPLQTRNRARGQVVGTWELGKAQGWCSDQKARWKTGQEKLWWWKSRAMELGGKNQALTRRPNHLHRRQAQIQEITSWEPVGNTGKRSRGKWNHSSKHDPQWMIFFIATQTKIHKTTRSQRSLPHLVILLEI
jgi:hypothetical protein